jgi:hypothetical protein
MHLIRRGGSIVAILALGAAAVLAGGRPRIAWDAGSVGGRDIWSANRKGKKVRLHSRAGEGDAALLGASPDGKRIAWLLTPPGTGGTSDLVVAKASRGGGRVVTETLSGRVVDAAFTGGSKHILFLFEAAATGRTHLYRTNAKGKGLRSPTLGTPGDAAEILAVSPHGAEAVLAWAFEGHVGVLLVDPVRGVVSVLDAGLPAGDAGGYAWFPAPGVLHFTWRPDGAERDDLWQLDAAAPWKRATAVRNARAIPGGTRVVVSEAGGDTLVLLGSDGESRFPLPGAFLAAGDGNPPLAPVVAVEDDGEIRIVEFPGPGGEAIDLLPDRTVESVEEIREVGTGGVLLAVREEGERRLHWTWRRWAHPHVDGLPLDPAEGLEGKVGAFRIVTADGTVIFAHVAAHGSSGELYAWRPDGERVGLIGRTGLLGLPGRAVVSPKTGDVLFNVVTMPDADNRLFLWSRKKDEVLPLSAPATRPGTYLFTR